MNIISIPSPNYNEGRKTYRPEAIVIHIMEGSLSGTDSWFQSTLSQVSAHYGVGKSGQVHQYVQEKYTAWHAGRVNAPSWRLIKPSGNGLFVNPNYYTIGIEHEGNENTEWTDEMYNASSSLIKDINGRWNIPLDRDHIIGHHEIYSLKTCPGNKVNINKLIALASGVTAFEMIEDHPETLMQGGVATTKVRLNIRSKPSRENVPANIVEPGIKLAFDGYTDNGESINGNSKWFYTNKGYWYWSGGVS